VALHRPVKTPVKTPVKILALLAANPQLTLAEVASHIGKSLSAVERAASRLVKAGRLKRVGPQKGGHWEVIQ
jgi:ATP-dependent DNA helicase RecG